jgi:hypothetical protein
MHIPKRRVAQFAEELSHSQTIHQKVRSSQKNKARREVRLTQEYKSIEERNIAKRHGAELF